jgi:predicted Zn-dependent protease
MVSFFERLQAREKKKTSKLSALFRSHPLTKNRIKNVQEAIDQILPEKTEYALGGSEFQQVQEQLNRLMSPRKAVETDPERPKLKRRPPSGEIPAEDTDVPPADEDERPTLKRHYHFLGRR